MASANSRFKTENGLYVTGGNAEFTQIVTVGGNCTVSGDLLFVGGNLTVQGTQVFQGGQIYVSNITASMAGLGIGNTTYAFDVYSANLFVNTAVLPLNNTIPLGNTTRRFVTYSNTLDVSTTALISGNVTISGTSHTIAGNVNIDSGVLFIDGTNNRVGINNTAPTTGVNLQVTGNANVSANLVTSLVVVNNAIFASNSKSVTSTTQVLVDDFPLVLSNCVKYLVFTRNTGNTVVHTLELMAIHDGTNVLLSQYGEVFNTSLGSFDVNINVANVELKFTATANGAAPNVTHPYTVKVLRTQIT